MPSIRYYIESVINDFSIGEDDGIFLYMNIISNTFYFENFRNITKHPSKKLIKMFENQRINLNKDIIFLKKIYLEVL